MISVFFYVGDSRNKQNQPTGSVQSTPTINPNDTLNTSVIFLNIIIIKVGYFGKLEFLDNQA